MATSTPASAAPWIVVTGLDGAGKSTLARRLTDDYRAVFFRLPYHDFVKPSLRCSGDGAPFGDVHTDRLLFALDARLANYRIRQWRATCAALVSQRGWMDNFIFGAVQQVSYRETDAMLRTAELERPTAVIYLVAEPAIAYGRIDGDPNRDKFETADFLVSQYHETLRFHQVVEDGHDALAPFAGIPSVLIDTSHRSPEAVYHEAEGFLRTSLLPFCMA